MSTEALLSDLQKVTALVKSIAKLVVDPPSDDVILANHGTSTYVGSGSSRQEVYEEKRRLTKAYEHIIVFDPNVQLLYPGSLIQGKSLPSGTLAGIGVGSETRTPITITVDGLVSSDPSVKFSKTIDRPDHGSVQELPGNLENVQYRVKDVGFRSITTGDFGVNNSRVQRFAEAVQFVCGRQMGTPDHWNF